MRQPDAFALGRSDLNDFLFADIGVERSGMTLSVVSALARQGLDPWQEAGRLAGLPKNTAAEGLAGLIAAMPASLWPLPDAMAIAARLVALLPGQEFRDMRYSPPPSPDGASSGRWLIATLLAVALLATMAPYVVPAPAKPAAAVPMNTAPRVLVPTRG